MSRTPGMGEAIGSGFARGVNQGIEEGNYEKRLGMHAKLTDMMQQQKQTREGKAFLEAMGPEMLKAYGMDAEAIDKYAPLGQGMLATLMQMKAEMGMSGELNQARSELRGKLSPKTTTGTPLMNDPGLGEPANTDQPENFVENRQPVRQRTLADSHQLIDETYDKLQQGIPITSKRYAEIEKARDKAKKDITSQTAANAQDRRANVAEKALGLKERESERKYNQLSKEDAKWLTDTRSSIEQTKSIRENLQQMKKIRESGTIGRFSSYGFPENRKAAGEYDNLAFDIFNGFSKTFGGKMLKSQFEYLKENHVPASNLTDATNEGREKAIKDMQKLVLLKEKIINKYEKPDGTYPKNIRSLVERGLEPELKKFKKEYLPKSTEKVQEDTQEPKENNDQQYPEGTEADVDGVPSILTNGQWVAR